MRLIPVFATVAFLAPLCGSPPAPAPRYTGPSMFEKYNPTNRASAPASMTADPAHFLSEPPITTVKAFFVAREVYREGGCTRPAETKPSFNDTPIAKTCSVRGVLCGPRDVDVMANTWSCTLAAPWTSQGITVDKGTEIAFYLDSAQLASAVFPSTVSLENVPCTGQTLLHPNGHLEFCALGTAHRFPNDVKVPAFSHVWFDDSGHLERVRLSEQTAIHGVIYAWDQEFFVDATGEPSPTRPYGDE